MHLVAHIALYPGEEHPRDILSFDLYPAGHASASIADGVIRQCLPVEASYSPAPFAKRPALAVDSPEAQLISALRLRAASAGSQPLCHALRCLATCLDNYSRYGCEESLYKVVSLAYTLHLDHCSRPYRRAFGEAHGILLNLIDQIAWHASPLQANCNAASLPQRVFYFAVVNTQSTRLPPVRIRLFEKEQHAKACLADWLSQYGIPYEVWRSLRGVMADELLPYTQDGLFATIGEKQIKPRPIV